MRRFVAALSVLAMPLVGFNAPAAATGYGICTITGTITFSSEGASGGTWDIKTAVIDCQGLLSARRRITGRGPFAGSGTFSALAPAGGGCLQQSGTGNVEYSIPTTGGTIEEREPVNHAMVGVGVLATPNLRGTFQLPPPYSGDCLTEPSGTSTFVAEVFLLRYPREAPDLPYID